MTRTSPLTLLVVALLGIGGGYVLDHALTVSGRPTFTPATTLPVLLVLIAGALILLAMPIRRATRSVTSRDSAQGSAAATRSRAEPVNPFRALRVAVLAKASSIVGSLVAGVAAGLGVYLLSRPVPPPLGSAGAVLATLIAALVLVVAALVAENMCTIRKDDDDEPPAPQPEPGHSHDW
ncbi:DUF3180 domain-containing protein [Microbacterium sp. LRZ72]|uniref:DUF3180 domain-containing protein n=1 Tax=Microbacterium sp. LRZ72 TaxID=2942481 RepID=UPI0029A072F8|nr:DUF3180 domain-containing protein [Microbacterium sp. LRZ72]MDX2377832.1 DUF3180 domain-containing protein [Microbacterium sp. LRZ72]